MVACMLYVTNHREQIMTDPKSYTGYVDIAYLELAAECARQDKQLSYAAMRLQSGYRVLDVGCGPGTDTLRLARLVGGTGRVIGVDYDPEMLAEANRRAAAAGLEDRVQHLLADAADLPFEENSFNAARSERLFQHLANPAAALAEMVRVTRPGGWIVVLETDYSTLSIESEETDLERRLARLAAEQVRSGYAARQLYRLFLQQRLASVSVEIRPQQFTSYALVRAGWLDAVERSALERNHISEEELDRWHRSLERLEQQGAFFASLNHLLVAGRKL